MRDPGKWHRLIGERLPDLSADPAREADIREELAQHLEDRYRSALSSGLDPADAFERACEELESPERAAALIRSLDRARPGPVPPAMAVGFWRGWGADFGYSLRVMRRHPSLFAFATLILAVGIGAATAIFSIVNGVLLQPLPYPSSDDIVIAGHPDALGRPSTVGYATVADWNGALESLEHLSGARSWFPTLVDEQGAARIAGVRVGHRYFDALGVRPEKGRSFTEAEDTPATWRVVVVSFAFWRDRLGSDPDAVGRSVRLSDSDYQVIGIMPEGFEDRAAEYWYGAPEVWAPLGYDLTLPWACRSCQHLRSVGRLRDGVSLAQAAAELQALQANLIARHRSQYGEGEGGVVSRLKEETTAGIRPALRMLAVAVALVLLISCANVANMFLARSIQRRKEISLRTALGAEKGRLVRLLLSESLLVALLGGGAALLAAPWAVRALLALAPEAVRRPELTALDWSVVLFAIGLSLAVGALFGVAPALAAVGGDLVSALRQDGRATPDPALRRGQRLLVTADLMLAFVLLCGALMMIQSVSNLLGVDPGFQTDRLLTAQITLVGAGYQEEAPVLAAVGDILRGVEGLPGVLSAAVTSQMPLTGSRDAMSVHIRDRLQADPSEAPWALVHRVTPGYFDTLGVRLLGGRLLTPEDRVATTPAMVVSESMARQLWSGDNPIGAEVRIGPADRGHWYQVVGVVTDVHNRDLASQPEPQMYVPLEQDVSQYLTLAVRTAGDRLDLASSMREAVARAAPAVPVFNFSPMRVYVAESAADRRFVSWLLMFFSLVAAALAGAGVYGLASYFVQQKKQELGVRAALGADRVRIARQVLSGSLRVALVGLAGGWLLVALARPLVERLLFGVSAFDLGFLTLSSLLLLAILLLSHLVPVLRAVRVDPAVALRGE